MTEIELQNFKRGVEDSIDVLRKKLDDINVSLETSIETTGSLSVPKLNVHEFQEREGVESFKLIHRGTGSYSNHFGVHSGKVFLDGTEIAQSGSFSFFTASFAVSATTYGYIDIDTTPKPDNPATWDLATGASVPAASAGHKIVPLWKINWDGTNSKVSSVDFYNRGDVYATSSMEITVITAMQWDSPNLQIKTRKIRVDTDAESEEWTTILTAEECP